MICLAMSGNGAPIGMVRIITKIVPGTIRKDPLLELFVPCVGVPGAVLRGTVALRFGSGSFPVTGTVM